MTFILTQSIHTTFMTAAQQPVSKLARGVHTIEIKLPVRLGHCLVPHLTLVLPVMPCKSLPQETTSPSAKRLKKSMKLLPEESLRLRVCMQLQEDALTKVLPVIARTCHLPHISSGAGCALFTGTVCRCHDSFTFPVANALSGFSDLWFHYSSVVLGPKSSKRINQHVKCLSKKEKLSCRHSRASYFSWYSKAIHIFLFILTQTLIQFYLTNKAILNLPTAGF